MGLPGGILLDKGHFRITLAVGSILYVFSCVFLVFSLLNEDFWICVFYFLRLPIGNIANRIHALVSVWLAEVERDILASANLAVNVSRMSRDVSRTCVQALNNKKAATGAT